MLILFLVGARAAPCALDVPPDTPFAVSAPATPGGAHLVVVIRGDVADPTLVEPVFAALERHGGHGTLAIRGDRPPDERIGALAPALADRGHTLAARLPAGTIVPDPENGPRRLRKTLRPARSVVGRFQALDGPAGDATAEAVAHRVGLRTVLETNGPASAAPRRLQRLPAQPDNGVVLPRGPYAGPCGTEHLARPFTPAAADRATQALHGAASVPAGFVRVTLAPTATEEITVLERWLTEVIVPGAIPIVSADDARGAALAQLRDRLVPTAPRAPVGGRLVALDQVRAAARDLQGATALSRTLSGELNPTEALLATALLLTDRTEQTVVRLPPLSGPPQLARSVLRGPVSLPRATVVAFAGTLLDDLPAAIPPALSVGGQLLTAPELLTLFASAVRGDDPAVAHPIDVPEPATPGLGWGTSEAP